MKYKNLGKNTITRKSREGDFITWKPGEEKDFPHFINIPGDLMLVDETLTTASSEPESSGSKKKTVKKTANTRRSAGKKKNPADVNQDGKVDAEDAIEVVKNIGK